MESLVKYKLTFHPFKNPNQFLLNFVYIRFVFYVVWTYIIMNKVVKDTS